MEQKQKIGNRRSFFAKFYVPYFSYFYLAGEVSDFPSMLLTPDGP